MTALINASTSSGVVVTSDTSGSLAIQNNGTTAMIVTGGAVGIGTTSPTGKLNVYASYVSDTGVQQRFEDNTGTALSFGGTGGGVKWLNVADVGSPSTGYPLTFQTGGVEAMRIAATGNVAVGTTVTGTNKFTTAQTASANCVYMVNSNATTSYGMQIYYSGQNPNNTGNEFIYCGDASPRFIARSNGGLANYSGNNVNLSDQREKKDIELAGNYLDKVCAIPVKTFNYIDQPAEDTEKTLGVIAQDVQAVAPELVSESNWANKDEPEKLRLSVYQTDLTFALMKSIQELKAELDATKAEVAALKGTV